MSWRDRQYRRQDEMGYPFIQWVNDGGSMFPRSEVGGFAMPTAQAAILGDSIPGEVCVLHHRGGNQTEATFATNLEVAVLDARFTWTKNDQAIPAYEPGARGKLQALALVRADDGVIGPVLLTFKGYTSKQFGNALKEHRNAVRVATANKAPAYAFFGRYQAGEVELVGSNGQQSPVTTLVYGGDAEFDPDAAYVKDTVLDTLDWDQIGAWKRAWDQPGGNGNGGNGYDDANDDPKPAPKDPNAPASEAQWKLVRKLLASINYVSEERQNTAIKEAGFDPGKLTMGQASKLIDRLSAAAKAAAAKK